MEAFKGLQRSGMGYHPVSDLRPTEFYMLHAIWHSMLRQRKDLPEGQVPPPGVTVSALSRMTHNSMPAASQILRGMEEKDIIRRVPAQSDRRRVYVCLTEQGEQLVEEAGNAFFRFWDDVANRMGDQDIEELIRLLDKLRGILEETKGQMRADGPGATDG